MFFPGCATGFHAPSRRRNIYNILQSVWNSVAWYCWNAAHVIQLMSKPLSERTVCSNFSRSTPSWSSFLDLDRHQHQYASVPQGKQWCLRPAKLLQRTSTSWLDSTSFSQICSPFRLDWLDITWFLFCANAPKALKIKNKSWPDTEIE